MMEEDTTDRKPVGTREQRKGHTLVVGEKAGYGRMARTP